MEVAVVSLSSATRQSLCARLGEAGIAAHLYGAPEDVADERVIVIATGEPRDCLAMRELRPYSRIIACATVPGASPFIAAGADDILPDETPTSLMHARLFPRVSRGYAGEEFASDQRFAELVQSIDATVWQADAKATRMTYVSPQVEQLLGYPAERWLEENFWQDHIHEDDREQAIKFCMMRTAELQDHTFEYRMIRADGRVIWVRDLVTVIAENGDPKLLRGVMYDVTEQVETATALRISEERFRAFAESTTTAMWAYDLDRWIYCNNAMVELTGYSREQLMTPGFFRSTVIAPEHRDTADHRASNRLLGAPLDLWMVYRIIRSNGEVRWVQTSGSTFHANGVTYGVANAIDVTERHRNEQELRQSEERLELALQGGELAAWDVDIESDSYIHDGRLTGLLGRELDSFGTYKGMASYVHPDDKARARVALVDHLKGKTQMLDHEFRVLGANDEWHWLRSRGRVVARDAAGRATRVAGTYQDITEQKRAEFARQESEVDLSAMFESSGDGIILLTPEFDILRANREARAAVLKYWGNHLDVTRRLDDQISPQAAESVRASMQRALETREFFTIEAELETLNGPVPHEMQFTPIYFDDGTLRGIGLAARNIVRRRNDEAALRQSQKLESLGQLVGGVAHDFNNLLAAILGYASLASASLPPSSPVRRDIDEVLHAAQSAADLTKQLLTFARRQHVEPRNVDVNELLPGVERLLTRIIGENIRLGVAPASESLIVRIDPGQFEQVVLNLAINARDAMAAGGRLTIQARRVADSTGKHPGWACIAVSDTGSGMSIEVIERIFEPFFTTKEQGKGTGLGLATCHGIVTHAGGKIEVLSEEARGTTMVVWLPLTEGDPVPVLQPAPQSAVNPREALILVVEDQPDVRTLTTRALTRYGYQVLSASGPVMAMEMATEHPEIDLIVSDIVMPMMDGVALLDLLGPVLGHKPVIFVSGYADQDVVERAVGRPGARFLSKPFALDALINVIDESLAASRAPVATSV